MTARRTPIDPALVDRADGLLVSGLSYRQVGQLLGVHPARLRSAVTRRRRNARVLPGDVRREGCP